jgi:F-type H+-transporting ATPase subunit delta
MFRPNPWAEAFIACAGMASEGAASRGAFAREALEYFRLYCRCALGLPGYLSGSDDAGFFDRAAGAALAKVYAGGVIEAAELARRFIILLIRRGRLKESAKVGAAIETRLNDRLGIIRADLSTAFDTDSAPSFLAGLQAALCAACGAAGVEVRARKDESLIGGFVLKVGSRLYDASLVSRLEKMRVDLSRPGTEEHSPAI